MQILKVSATSSTNSYLRQISKDQILTDDFLVWTENQLAGRGQMGTTWESESFKNLTFSVFRKVLNVPLHSQFAITMATSLAVYEALKELGITQIFVKWPNDILAGDRKICGILIESIIKGSQLEAVIIGVGLNVNQTVFKIAPRATSILNETGVEYKQEEILSKLVDKYTKYVQILLEGKYLDLKMAYEDKLYRNGKPSMFEYPNGKRVPGIIQGITETGRLQVLFEDNQLSCFDLKEIKLLY